MIVVLTKINFNHTILSFDRNFAFKTYSVDPLYIVSTLNSITFSCDTNVCNRIALAQARSMIHPHSAYTLALRPITSSMWQQQR